MSSPAFRLSFWALAGFLLVLAVASCDDGATPTGSGPGSGPTVGSSSSGGTGGDGAGVASGGGGGGGGSAPVPCPTTITYEAGGPTTNVRLAGEWQGFDLATAIPMQGPTAGGAYTATVDLYPGLYAYKIVYDDGQGGTQWVLNPSEGRRKYAGGVENSAIKVRDCARPSLAVDASEASRPSPGQGTFEATLSYVAPITGSPADPAGFTAELKKDDESVALGATELVVAADGSSTVALAGLADGKYRLLLTPRSQSGATG